MKNIFKFSAPKAAALAVVTLAGASIGVHADKAPKSFHASMGKAPAAKATTVVFDISKIHCEGCASGLEQAAKRRHGVQSGDVSYAQKRALVTFDPRKTTPARIAREFKRIGFPAKVAH
jgi:copper chaperone CopZ